MYVKRIYFGNMHLSCLRSDELPVQLSLPRALREAKNRQQLSSLALLGQGEYTSYTSSSFNRISSLSPSSSAFLDV